MERGISPKRKKTPLKTGEAVTLPGKKRAREQGACRSSSSSRKEEYFKRKTGCGEARELMTFRAKV